jgi:hypothetical protein
MAVDARGIPLGTITAPASRHDSPLLVPTLGKRARGRWVRWRRDERPPRDRGYDSLLTRERLEELGLGWEISGKGKPAPYWATFRWVVERTSSWPAKLAHKKLFWCTERVGRVIDFWVAFSEVVIMVEAGHLWPSRKERRPACKILGGGTPVIHRSAWKGNSPKFAGTAF